MLKGTKLFVKELTELKTRCGKLILIITVTYYANNFIFKRLIVDNLSEDQLKRYERFRRVGLARPIMERLMQRILDQRVNSTSVIVLAGIAKVFVGELVEGARIVMEEELRAQLELNVFDPDELEESIIIEMQNRPLEPFHIIESHRRMQQESFSAPPSLIYSKSSPF